MEKRRVIEDTVLENPGISLTELKEQTGFANGTLQHHLRKSDKLEKKKDAILEKNRCQSCIFRSVCTDSCIHRSLRDPVKRRIISMLDKELTYTEISRELDLSVSTVSYHISRLENRNLLENGRPRPVVSNFIPEA